MSQNKLKDESKDRSYFILTPQIVWALSRNPYDYALWNVIKMIAGEDKQCILATPDLAKLAMMSAGQVSESRKYLLECGLLTGEYKRDPGYPQPVWHLRVPDLWPKNIAWRHALGDEISKRIELKQEQKESLHTVKPSHSEEGIISGEEGIIPGETKDILIEEPKEEPPKLPFGVDGHQRAIDKANGSRAPDSVEEVAKHLCWLCNGQGVPLPKTQRAKADYEKAARILLELTNAEDWHGVCAAIDEWSESPPIEDKWWHERTKSPHYAIAQLKSFYWSKHPSNGGPGGPAPVFTAEKPDWMKD